MHTGAALIAALIVMLVSLIGVIFTAGRLGAWMQRYLTYLATFSAGVFLLVAYSLAEEAVHEGGWLVGIFAVLLGAALMEAMQYFLPTQHHHHEHVHDHQHSSIDGRRVLVSDALHNIGDGILLVGAFSAGWYIGIAATVGVLLHEAVQEISEFFVLKEAGYSTRHALGWSFAVSATILIGFFLATSLASVGFFVALLSGIAAGGFLSVVLHDLLPHALASIRTNGKAHLHIIVGLAGAGAMLILQITVPHEHEEVPAAETETAASMEIPAAPMPAGKTAPAATSKGNPAVAPTPAATSDSATAAPQPPPGTIPGASPASR